MFSVITNIYKKKTKGPTLMELFTAKRLRRTLHTVVFDIDSSLASVHVDFFGLCRKLARTRSTSSSAVNGRPLDFYLHRHLVSVNFLVVSSIGTGFVNMCLTIFL